MISVLFFIHKDSHSECFRETSKKKIVKKVKLCEKTVIKNVQEYSKFNRRKLGYF